MLRITIPGEEFWDEQKEMFIATKETTLQLEHSLVSIAKWESTWHKGFFSKKPQTKEEESDYIRCMTITQNVDPEVYSRLTEYNFQLINDYIDNPMTATYISEQDKSSINGEPITSELIYYWMIALNIPPEYQKWHLNRLITLIRVCNIKNNPPKKRSRSEILRSNAALNEIRRNQLKTKG